MSCQVSALPDAFANGKNDDQTRNNDQTSDNRNKYDATSACWEFASDDIVLAFEIAVKADEEHNDADAYECRTKRLSNMS